MLIKDNSAMLKGLRYLFSRYNNVLWVSLNNSINEMSWSRKTAAWKDNEENYCNKQWLDVGLKYNGILPGLYSVNPLVLCNT